MGQIIIETTPLMAVLTIGALVFVGFIVGFAYGWASKSRTENERYYRKQMREMLPETNVRREDEQANYTSAT